jgi:Uma2 family endonuclease
MATLNVPSPRSGSDGTTPATPSAKTLENGDRLTRGEFERRYEARPDIKKAELIEGVVHMPSPTRSGSHARPHAATITWLGSYAASTPGVQVNDNPTVRLDLDNEPQPDAALLIDPGAGGQARLSDDDYIEGAPELIAEIASSSASYDLHDKLHAYRRNGVREYLVWRTLEHRIDWLELVDGAYWPLQPDAAGLIHSRVFPGLRLAVDAMLRGDLAAVLRELQHGLGENVHQAFVARLAGRSPFIGADGSPVEG